MDLGRAMERAQVLDWSLQEMVRPHMSQLKPRPSIYIPDFIAANQEHRADNVLTGTMAEQVRRSEFCVLCICKTGWSIFQQTRTECMGISADGTNPQGYPWLPG